MKSILHDWDDEKAATILKNCRASMKKDSQLLIIDAVISKDNAPHPAKWKDLMMMVVYGSGERTEREFQNLLGRAGFKLKRVTALPLPDALIEALPV